MRKMWVMASGVIWACGGGGSTPEPAEPSSGREAVAESTTEAPALASSGASGPSAEAQGPAEPGASKTKLTSECVPKPGTEPKRVAGENSASEVADPGRALLFDVAGISLELPACTPGADLAVLTMSWETKDRPISSHIHPDFTRHAATVRVDQPIEAAEGAPLLVTLHTRRDLSKPKEKLVVAIEHSGECDDAHKRDPLEFGECSHWQLFDVEYDEQRKEMVAEVPSIGGYRIQFGWMPRE